MTAQQIIDEIDRYVGRDHYSNWYAGIASDPEDCLFVRHNVDRSGRWIHCPADNASVARITESALHRAGFDGGPGGGDITTAHVYTYRKTAATNED